MRVPTPAQLLDLWEAGARASAWDRAALLLHCAWPDSSVAQWPIGLANARLLALRAALFGARWDCVADCPACAQVADVQLDIAALLAGAPGDDSSPATVWHVVDGSADATRFRLPLLGDLTQAGEPAPLSAAHMLERILDSPDAIAVTPALRTAIEDRLLRLDPLAAIDMLVDCPSCGHRWRAATEVVGMLWTELANLAKRLLGEVARLAAVFGWSEAQILALSPRRRQHYLELVREW